MKTQSSSRLRGFTLVELIIVIVIIGVLAAIAVPQFNDVSSQAKTAAAQGTAAALQGAGAAQLAAGVETTCADLAALVTPAVNASTIGGSGTSCTYTAAGQSAITFYNAAGNIP